MNQQKFDTQKIISKLQFFNYKYELEGDTLKVYLPMWCYLKIRIGAEKVKLSSHIRFGFHFLSLEYNFLIYSLALYLISWFQWAVLNKGIFVLFGLFIIHFVISFIRIESTKTIIHQWVETES